MEVEEQPVSEDVPLVSSSRGHQVELGNLADNDGRIAVVDSVNKFQWGFFYVFCFLVDHCISYIAGVVSKCLLRLFCGLYCLAGQYINCEKSSSKCFSVFGFFCFFLQLCLCVGYVGTVGTIEGLRIANYSFIINITVNDSINCTLPQEHWKFSTAVTVSAVAAIFLRFNDSGRLNSCLYYSLPLLSLKHAALVNVALMDVAVARFAALLKESTRKAVNVLIMSS